MTNAPQHRRRRGAALLALLWSLYMLLGGTGGFMPAPSMGGRAQTSPAHACRMCRMHPGKPCCCHPAPGSSPQAVCTARCDQGAPATFAAAHSWPTLAPPTTPDAPRPPALSRPALAGGVSLRSVCSSPPTPPPCLS